MSETSFPRRGTLVRSRSRFVLELVLIVAAFALIVPVACAAEGTLPAPGPLSPELLAALASGLLSLLLAYTPGLCDWYSPLSGQVKALLMGLLLLVVSVAIYAGSCGGWWTSFGVTCDRQGLFAVIGILVSALMANQGTFMIAVDPFKTKGNAAASAGSASFPSPERPTVSSGDGPGCGPEVSVG